MKLESYALFVLLVALGLFSFGTVGLPTKSMVQSEVATKNFTTAYEQVFVDNFNGTGLDPNTWQAYTQRGDD